VFAIFTERCYPSHIMLGCTFVGPRAHPCVSYKGTQFLMEHRFYATESMLASALTLDADGEPEGLLEVELALFWLFGFGLHQVECVYQGPSPLPDVVLAKIVPAMRDAVRAELQSGQPQVVNL
jgi:hypothetical protein